MEVIDDQNRVREGVADRRGIAGEGVDRRHLDLVRPPERPGLHPRPHDRTSAAWNDIEGLFVSSHS